jgi:hypothetical protein
MTFEAAERVADAVLYEGYVLYPYRASAIKNKYRWQFGVIAPQSPHDDQEPSFAQTECLIEPKSASPRLLIRVRFLRPQAVGRDNQPSRCPVRRPAVFTQRCRVRCAADARRAADRTGVDVARTD